MSYLDVPRLHFFGTFQTNPSTINNTPSNYSLPPDPNDEGWNPNGSHSWTLQGCTVQTVIGPGGSSPQDPLVGTAVSSAATPSTNPQCNVPSTPKLVDLDTEQQMVSTIFGLQIQIGDSSSGMVTGTFQPQPFLDIYGGAGSGGAYYQSVLQDLTWSQDLTSPVLQELQKVSPEALSIKFNLLIPGITQGQPATGSIAGTIGPACPGEPPNFLLGRLMRPESTLSALAFSGHTAPTPRADAPPQLNYSPFMVNGNRGKVIVDLGNSLPMAFSAGPNTPEPDSSLGTMQVAIISSQGSPQILGTVESTAAAYQTTALVQEFDVTAEQVTLLQSSILAVLLEGSQALAEDANATYLGLTPMVCRLNPGDSVQIDLVALSFGSPATSQTIQIVPNNTGLQPEPGLPVGTPESALQISPASVTTDANGRASFTLTAAPEGPGSPRGTFRGQKCYLDGQIYGVGFSWPLEPSPDPSVFVSVHIYELVAVPDSPTWETDVQPILLPYDELYPFMASMINLSSEEDVLQNPNPQQIWMRLQLPESDPRLMPVTRDLSANKKQIVLNWLAQQMKS